MHVLKTIVIYGIVAALSALLLLWNRLPRLPARQATSHPVSSSTGSFPELGVVLTPQYHDADGIIAIKVSVNFTMNPDLDATRGLIYGVPFIANTPTLRVAPGTLHAWDSSGNLSLTEVPSNNSNRGSALDNGIVWAADRQPRQSVHIVYIALPRHVDINTRSGPALDFVRESGGASSSGFALLVTPADTDTTYTVRLSWDLSQTPAETKAIWTYGDASMGVIAHDMTALDLIWTYFAVGPLTAYNEAASARFNVYWFSAPPFDAPKLSTDLDSLFAFMSRFFHDDSALPYRVILRHNPHPGTNTGTALKRSFMFGWDDSDFVTDRASSYLEKLLVLAHEMVHNWILWGPSVPLEAENWYPEGWAEYYSLTLLHRAGLLSATELVRQINRRLSAYYTSPYVRHSLDEVARHTWESTPAQRQPYRRGFVFALVLDALIRQAAGRNGHREGNYEDGDDTPPSMDTLVLELIRRSRAGLRVSPADFVAKLGELIADEALALALYANLTEGSTVFVPPPDALALLIDREDLFLVRQDQEIFELGFDEASLHDERVVRGLVGGSRADLEAGVKNGDCIVSSSLVSPTELDFQERMSMKVSRACGEGGGGGGGEGDCGDEERVLEFWPRAWAKAESWKFEFRGHLGEL